MTIHAAFSLRHGDLTLDVDLIAPAGEVTAVLGPNGAGKTTLLRCIAGSLAIDAGTITLDGAALDSPPTVLVPQERRHLGVVHQDHLLFGHLTVLDNVAFGPRAQGRTTTEAHAIAAELLATVGISELGQLKPGALSGGQAQRVALARALATSPAALLLDEPLGALDASTRSEVRRDLKRFLGDFAGPTILVTHDPIDALALADHVAILEHGQLTQTGTLAEVTTRPRTRYVADLIGTNLIHGVADGTTITTEGGATLTAADANAGAVFATIAPSAVALHLREPDGSPRNRWHTTVEQLEPLGDRVRVTVTSPLPLTAEITAAAAAELGLREGDQVWATVKATEVATYLR